MKKLARLLALILACMLVFGTVTAAAEAEVDEVTEEGETAEDELEADEVDAEDWEAEEADEEEAGEEDAEAEEAAAETGAIEAWLEYKYMGLRFLAPETWEITDAESSIILGVGEHSDLVIKVFDEETEGELPEDYGQEAVEFIEASEPELLQEYSYTLNGLDVECWYANNIQNEEYYSEGEELGCWDIVMFRFTGEDLAGYIYGVLDNTDLKKAVPGLTGMLFSLAPEAAEAEEEAAEEETEEIIEEIEEEGEEVIEEIEEEAEEIIEEVEEAEAEIEEEAEEEEAEAEEEEAEVPEEDVEAEETEEEAEESDELVWVEYESDGIRFCVPESWVVYEEEGGFTFEIDEDGEAAFATVPIEQFEGEVTNAEEFFALFDEELDYNLADLGLDVYQKYDPFKLNGLDMKLYNMSLSLEDLYEFQYIYFIFYGEDACGYSTAMIFNFGETDMDSYVPIMLGFLTSVGLAEDEAVEVEE